MKSIKNYLLIFAICIILLFTNEGCQDTSNKTAFQEQAHTEQNQRQLNEVQPAPRITWSLERDNLIKRFKLQNDRTVVFYMYLFVEGIANPIGYYQVNKVSSVNSQLTNPEQIAVNNSYGQLSLPSPAEDGSYGTNGDGVFGFTPEDIYIEHDLHYVVSTVPLNFNVKPNLLTVIDVSTQEKLKVLMDKLK